MKENNVIIIEEDFFDSNFTQPVRLANELVDGKLIIQERLSHLNLRFV